MTLAHLKDEAPVIVGLPRGGVPVAFEVANALNAPLDLALVRKIGAPGQPELAIGAVVDDGIATGIAMRVAIVGFAARGRSAPRRRLPVALRDTAGALQSDGDEFVCLFAPKVFDAVGSFYEDCSQTLDEAVIAPLDQAMKLQAAVRTRPRPEQDAPVRYSGTFSIASTFIRGQAGCRSNTAS